MEIFAITEEGNLIPSDEQAVHNRNKEGGLPQIVIIPEKLDEVSHPFLESLNLHPLLLEKCTGEEDDIGTTVFIETDQPLQLNLDGEPMRDTHFEFEIISACLPCILPAHSPLLI